MDNGHTVAELKEAFGIFASTLDAWRKLMKETGSLETRAIPGRPPTIDLEKLKQAIEEKPDAYLRELAEPYNCSTTAVFNALKKIKFTYKKTFTYSEKSEEKRAEFLAKIQDIPAGSIVYVDESGIDEYLQREKGRALRGVKIQDTKRGRRFQRMNVVAGLNGQTAIATLCYTGTTTSTVFEDWFAGSLLPSVAEGSTVIMDNASFHRKSKLHELALNNNVEMIFLPPYSPDYNPIEKLWANMKRWLRDNLPCFATIEDAVYDYL
jgi:transposase